MNRLIDATVLLAGMALLSTVWIACDSVDDSPGNLSGVVSEVGTAAPLPDITVVLDGAEATTDANGRFEFRNLLVGAVTIQVSTPGFNAYSKQLHVRSGDNSLDISLERRNYYEYYSEWGNHGLYLTPGVSTYRGVIFLGPPSGRDTRGFASGIARASPGPGLNEFVAAERERSLVLAEKYGLALMGVEGTALDGNGTRSVLAALEQIAGESGHPELAHAPLLMMGFSFGGGFAYEFAIEHSERAIGFISQKACCYSRSNAVVPRLVPGYLVVGETDTIGRAEAGIGLFEGERAQGALWALAVEPGAGHVAVCDQALLFHWMDVILERRLPETVIPGAPVALNALDEGSGWLGHQETFAIADHASYTDDRLQASWLPSSQTAQDWQTFVSGANTELNCLDFFGMTGSD